MTISWNTVIFKFRWIFGTDERRILSRQTIHTSSCGSQLFRVSFVATDQRTSTKTPYGRFVPPQFTADPSQKSNKIWKWTYFKNGHRIKITQPNWMIKASFSSAEDAPSNDVKKYNTFSSQCTENPPFRFFWDTRYCTDPLKCYELYPWTGILQTFSSSCFAVWRGLSYQSQHQRCSHRWLGIQPRL